MRLKKREIPTSRREINVQEGDGVKKEGGRCQLHQSVGHYRCKLIQTLKKFPICDDEITKNDRYVIKVFGIY